MAELKSLTRIHVKELGEGSDTKNTITTFTDLTGQQARSKMSRQRFKTEEIIQHLRINKLRIRKHSIETPTPRLDLIAMWSLNQYRVQIIPTGQLEQMIKVVHQSFWMSLLGGTA